MKKKYLFIIVCFVTALIGLRILLKSPTLGNNALGEFVRVEMGGSMDSSGANIMLEQYISTYRLLGGILLGGGFLGTIVSLFKIIF